MKTTLVIATLLMSFTALNAQRHPNKNNPNPELHIGGGAANFPPNNVNRIPSQIGFLPYGGASWQPIADTSNGITNYVLQIEGDDKTANPTAMFRLGNTPNQKIHIDIFMRVLEGPGARIGVSGSTLASNGGYADLQTGITNSAWTLYSFDLDDAGASSYDLRLHISASLGNGNGRVQCIISSKDRNYPVSSGQWSDSDANIYFNSGNVGIGTTSPDSKLAVNGNIHAKEVKVDLIGWPDYVFEKSYDLPSLKEIENHIKENGHLINIPSAIEVKENGILLGEMNKLLLEKIEEMTLYTIQQNKALNAQKEINRDMENRLVKLEKTVKFCKTQSVN